MSVTSYRTKDGRADYCFSFERQSDGTWHAYILHQPSYQGRDTSSEATHRLDIYGRPRVCWTKSLHSEQEARQVAALWADKTQDYIKTGRRF